MVETAAILCGGMATRLRPLTEKIPKALVEVAGRPFIDWQLSLLERKGIRKVVLCVGHIGQEIERVVGNGDLWGLKVEYSYDGAELLGTAGALKKAVGFLGDRFWVLYGDSYLNFDYHAVSDYFEREGNDKAGLMTVFENKNRWDKSNVIFSQGRIIVYDKVKQSPEMDYIDYGAAILRASALDLVPNRRYDLADLYNQLVNSGLILGYEVKERFYEIGSYEGIEETARYFAALQN